MPAPGSLSISSPSADYVLLDNAPMGRRQYWIWLLASGGTLLDGLSIFSLGVAMPLVTSQFGLSSLMVGLIGSALVLGAVFGAAFGGPAADRFGRKPAFLIDMTLIAVGALVSASADKSHWVLLGQLLVGIGIGIDFPVSASYVSEMMPKRARSRMVVATIALQSVGMLVGAAIAIMVLQQWTSPSDWRLFVGVTGAFALLFLLFRFRLPESPRWLAEQESGKKAARIATLVVAGGNSVSAMLSSTEIAPTTERAAATPQQGRFDLLFSRSYRSRTLLVSVPWFLMDIATYGVGLFTPVILGAIHLSAATTGPLAAEFIDVRGTAAIDVFLLVGFVVGLWAVPRFGRLHMQAAGFIGMTFGMLILLFAVLAGGGAAAHVPLIFAGFIFFNLAMNAGPNATTFALASELFPTGIRASASGFAAATAKVGATLGIFVLPQVKEYWGVAAVLAMMAAVSVLGAAVTAILSREVREVPEGKGLDEVADGSSFEPNKQNDRT